MTQFRALIATLAITVALAGLPTHAIDEELKPFARSCALLLKAVRFEDYVKAVQATELTPQALRAAENKLLESFAHFPWTRRNSKRPPFIANIQNIFSTFTGAVGAQIRGQTEISEEWTDTLLTAIKLSGGHIQRQELRSSIVTTASDPDIYRASAMAEFILQKAPSVEALLFQVQGMVPGLSELEFPGAHYTGPIIGGPRQAEMIRTALQYTLTRPEDHVLEIGYGTPAVLLGYGYYTRIKNLTGVDPFVLPERANEVLQSAGIELLQGWFPDSQDILERLKQKSPFSVILALDTLKNRQVLDTNVLPREFAKTIYELLADGGTAVIMNDFAEEPYFNLQDAKSVGFTIIRWGEVRVLPDSLRALMPYDPAITNAGHMKAFVLRKGLARTERVRLTGVIRPGS